MSQTRAGECWISSTDEGGNCPLDATHETFYKKESRWVVYCEDHASYLADMWGTSYRVIGESDTEEMWDE